jgi:hypothetical protein
MKMNTKYRALATEFGPVTRFEVTPTPTAPFRAVQESRFELLKTALTAERLQSLATAGYYASVRRAANEAAALAWTTPYPLLVFPALFEEKVDSAQLVAARQKDVLKRSRELLAV